MAYRQTDRQQMWLLPESIEKYVTSQDPVRAYDAFIDALDFNSLGIEFNPHNSLRYGFYGRVTVHLSCAGLSLQRVIHCPKAGKTKKQAMNRSHFHAFHTPS